MKGGGYVGPTPVRELGFVVDQNKAEMGVLVMLDDPSPAMKRDAVNAGSVQTAHGKFPKLQIASIADLFDGRRPLLPHRAPLERLRTADAPAERHRPADRQMAFTFHFEGGRKVEPSGDVVYLDPNLVYAESGVEEAVA